MWVGSLKATNAIWKVCGKDTQRLQLRLDVKVFPIAHREFQLEFNFRWIFLLSPNVSTIKWDKALLVKVLLPKLTPSLVNLCSHRKAHLSRRKHGPLRVIPLLHHHSAKLHLGYQHCPWRHRPHSHREWIGQTAPKIQDQLHATTKSLTEELKEPWCPSLRIPASVASSPCLFQCLPSS